MGGSSSTTTTASPPAWAMPLFQRSGQDALDLYNSGSGGNTYRGSTVTPFSDQTIYGINALGDAGDAWNTANGTRDLYSRIGQQSYDMLKDTASGKYLESGNPYYRERLDREVADSNAMIRSAFSGMGRYGSGANQQAIAENTSDMLLSGLENDWNRERGFQMGAINDLYNQSMGVTDRLYGQDQQNYLNRLTGADAQIRAGQMLDDKSQQYINDEVRRFYALDNEDWNRLGMLNAAAAGAAGGYGTQQSNSRSSPGIGQILGGIGGIFGGK